MLSVAHSRANCWFSVEPEAAPIVPATAAVAALVAVAIVRRSLVAAVDDDDIDTKQKFKFNVKNRLRGVNEQTQHTPNCDMSKIIYSLVARKDVVLAECAIGSGNFAGFGVCVVSTRFVLKRFQRIIFHHSLALSTEVTKKILLRIPPGDGRQAYTYDRHGMLDLLLESCFLFVSVSVVHNSDAFVGRRRSASTVGCARRIGYSVSLYR